MLILLPQYPFRNDGPRWIIAEGSYYGAQPSALPCNGIVSSLGLGGGELLHGRPDGGIPISVAPARHGFPKQ